MISCHFAHAAVLRPPHPSTLPERCFAQDALHASLTKDSVLSLFIRGKQKKLRPRQVTSTPWIALLNGRHAFDTYYRYWRITKANLLAGGQRATFSVLVESEGGEANDI